MTGLLILLSLTRSFSAEPDFSMFDKVVSEALPNGLRVAILPDKRTDTAALHIAYNVGSRDEQAGEFGCAHLFEHLMFEGSANVPTNKFDAWLTSAGGNNNAWTSEDTTAYHMAFPSGALDVSLFLESDRLGFLDAGLDATNVTNQQSVVLQERARGYSRPHGRDWDALNKLSFAPEHPYHHAVIGTVADIEAFAIDKVRHFWDVHYRTDNAVLGLAGAVDAEQALAALRLWFSDVPSRGAAPVRLTWDDVKKYPFPAANGMIEDDINDQTLMVAYRTVPRMHPDNAALELLSHVLSNGRGTRLDDAMYYNSTVATEVGAYAFGMDIDGVFLVSVSSESSKLTKLDKGVGKVISKLVTSPPTQEELDRAKLTVRFEMIDNLEDPESVAEVLADCVRDYDEPNCLPMRWREYDAVTTADLLRVAQTYIINQPRSTLSVVPRGSSLALEGATVVELP